MSFNYINTKSRASNGLASLGIAPCEFVWRPGHRGNAIINIYSRLTVKQLGFTLFPRGKISVSSANQTNTFFLHYFIRESEEASTLNPGATFLAVMAALAQPAAMLLG